MHVGDKTATHNRVCSHLINKINYFDYEKKCNRFFRFIATCKSVIRNIKSILVINALLMPSIPKVFHFLYWQDKSQFLKSIDV